MEYENCRTFQRILKQMHVTPNTISFCSRLPARSHVFPNTVAAVSTNRGGARSSCLQRRREEPYRRRSRQSFVRVVRDSKP